MTNEKALLQALKIIEICKKYGAEDRCTQCPFNIGGCVLTDGNNVPTEWRAGEVVGLLKREGRRCDA